MANRPMKRRGVRMHRTTSSYWILFRYEGGNENYSEIYFPIEQYPDVVSAMAGFLRGEGHLEDRHYISETDWDQSFFKLQGVEPWSIDL